MKRVRSSARRRKSSPGLQAEILILIKGFDDTFSQTVNARYSYRYDEIAWGANLIPHFTSMTAVNMVLEIDSVGDFTAPSDETFTLSDRTAADLSETPLS